ncbi:MAG: hypothetical protein MJE77_12860 [Proteobacteria bacterium]|nr:hypothetical protein [Pseudomonadota bacterium]
MHRLLISSLREIRIISCAGRLLGVLAVVAILGVCQHAEARTGGQGTSIRGTWLEGDTLIGVQFNPGDPGRFSVLNIPKPYGENIEAKRWSADHDWIDVVLPARALVGLYFTEQRCTAGKRCARIEYRIAHAMPDQSPGTVVGHRDDRDIWLYRVEYTTAQSPRSRDWKNVCREDRQGLAMGLFVPGQWNSTGARIPAGYTFACTSGVIAKCARLWGYRPWQERVARGPRRIDLQPLHQACVRAARADYCGDGTSQTRDGTIIDLFDRHGFNTRESNNGFSDEAGFDEDGAVWVKRPRWPGLGSTRDRTVLFETCERPRQSTTPGHDTALVYVRSPVEPRME